MEHTIKPTWTIDRTWEPVEVTIGRLMPGGPPPDAYRRFVQGPMTATLTSGDRTWHLTPEQAEALDAGGEAAVLAFIAAN